MTVQYNVNTLHNNILFLRNKTIHCICYCSASIIVWLYVYMSEDTYGESSVYNKIN